MLSVKYTKSDRAFASVQMGYAPAIGSICSQDVTLRYLNSTWRKVEP